MLVLLLVRFLRGFVGVLCTVCKLYIFGKLRTPGLRKSMFPNFHGHFWRPYWIFSKWPPWFQGINNIFLNNLARAFKFCTLMHNYRLNKMFKLIWHWPRSRSPFSRSNEKIIASYIYFCVYNDILCIFYDIYEVTFHQEQFLSMSLQYLVQYNRATRFVAIVTSQYHVQTVIEEWISNCILWTMVFSPNCSMQIWSGLYIKLYMYKENMDKNCNYIQITFIRER